nr:MAG TPA: CopG-like protein [Caudoviricetes sp.]
MINQEKNKRMMIVIPRETYLELEKLAKDNTRSVSKQALHYIKKGLDEEKRAKSL